MSNNNEKVFNLIDVVVHYVTRLYQGKEFHITPTASLGFNNFHMSTKSRLNGCNRFGDKCVLQTDKKTEGVCVKSKRFSTIFHRNALDELFPKKVSTEVPMVSRRSQKLGRKQPKIKPLTWIASPTKLLRLQRQICLPRHLLHVLKNKYCALTRWQECLQFCEIG